MERSGVAPGADGAFERFLTAAIATIITIMFSWRLLDEEAQREGAQQSKSPAMLAITSPPTANTDNDQGQNMNATSGGDIEPSIKSDTVQRCDTKPNQNIADDSSQNVAADSLQPAGDDCPSDDEDAPSWGNYSWEEDVYTPIHTRRSAKDFVSSKSTPNGHIKTPGDNIDPNSMPVSQEMLENLYVNREYREIVGNPDYETMHISDSSSDSSDDEGGYDPHIVDSDEDLYCPPGLEPIIEEDSDDLGGGDSDTSESNENPNQKQREKSLSLSLSDLEGEGENSSETEGVIHSMSNKNIDPCDNPGNNNILFTPETVEELGKDLDILESKIDKFEDKMLEEEAVSELDDVLDDFDDDDVDENCRSSPVRTCAIDDDENLSDESCSTCSSSASVVTVVSVKAEHVPKLKVENESKPSDTMKLDPRIENDINNDLIAFIHNVDNPDLESVNALQGDILVKSNEIGPNPIKYPSTNDIQTTECPKGSVDNSPLGVENDVDINYNDFVKNIEAQSEHVDLITNSSAPTVSCEPVRTESDSSEPISANEERLFDDDVQPRELNPYDDDFCDLLNYQDSDDDDSFFMVVGNQGHLRKLETFNNLDSIGVSPIQDDSRNSSTSSDERTFVFSRTEEITTEKHLRYYVKDRDDYKVDSLDDIKLYIEECEPTVYEQSNSEKESDVLTESESINTEIDENTRALNEINSAASDIDFIDSGAFSLDSSDDSTLSRNIHNSLEIKKSVANEPVDKLPNKCESESSVAELSTEGDINIGNVTEPNSNRVKHQGEEFVSNIKILETLPESQEKDSIVTEANTPISDNLVTGCEIKSNPKTDYSEAQGADPLPLCEVTNNSQENRDEVIPESKSDCVEVETSNSLQELNALNDSEDNILCITEPIAPVEICALKNENVFESTLESKVVNSELTTETRDCAPSGNKPEVNIASENIDANSTNAQNGTENNTINDLEKSVLPCIERLSSVTESLDENEPQRGQDVNEYNNDISSEKHENYKRNLQIWNNYLDPSIGRIDRSPAKTPSTFGVKAKLSKLPPKRRSFPKRYSSVLQQPISPAKITSPITSIPAKPLPLSRQKIFASRQKFLSAENLSASPLQDKFSHHKASFTNSHIPGRFSRYQKRDHATTKLGSRNSSLDRLNHISNYYSSRYSSDDSFEKPELDALHEDCIFSPHKHEQILNTTQSIDNLATPNDSLRRDLENLHFKSALMRYGSVASLETDIDSGETTETIYVFNETDIDSDFDLQNPLQRAFSMSELTSKTRRSTGRGRFADRNVPKSKSLMTLETDIDDVFTAKGEGNLVRTPSVHELRVTKSLSKLNVPDWFKNSSVSRSGSTFSLYGSQQRRDSTSTTSSFAPSITASPCPSVTPGGNPVVIRTRVTPVSAKLLRAPKLPMTPEKSPIAPSSISLPSDKFRKKEKPKELMPIPIVPFSKLRLMFEKTTPGKHIDNTKSSQRETSSPVKSPVQSPVSPIAPPVTVVGSQSQPAPTQNAKMPPSILKKRANPMDTRFAEKLSPSSEFPKSVTRVEKTVIEQIETITNGEVNEDVHHPKSVSPTAASPTSSHLTHSDQKPKEAPVNNEHNSKPVRYSKTQQDKPPVQPKPNSLKLLMSRKPNNSSKSRKGKGDFCSSEVSHFRHFRSGHDYAQTLFDYLQKLRYNRISNESTDQVYQGGSTCGAHVQSYTFPVLSIGQDSPKFLEDLTDDTTDGDIKVIMTSTTMAGDTKADDNSNATVEEVLKGLLLLNEHKLLSEMSRRDRTFSDDSLRSSSPSWSTDDHRLNRSTADDQYFSNLNEADDIFVQSDKAVICCKNCGVRSFPDIASFYFKPCHYCYTLYCSRQCRWEDWVSHKRICAHANISSACKHVIKFSNKDSQTQYSLSRTARRGYLSQGRGCVMLIFPNVDKANYFLSCGIQYLDVPPVYVSMSDLKDVNVMGQSLPFLVDICSSYNPDLKYVLHVVVPSPDNTLQETQPRNKGIFIQKSAKLRLSPAHMHPKDYRQESSTLILTAIPGVGISTAMLMTSEKRGKYAS